MHKHKLDDFTKGWVVGDFDPSLIKTKNFEVAVKKYKAGDKENKHFHKQAEEISIIVSDSWKYGMYSKIIELISQTGRKNISEISKHIMGSELKKHGQEIMKLLPKIVEKLPDRIIPEPQEFDAFNEAIELYTREFSTTISVINAANSTEAKAKQAMPGKPAIIVK